MTQAAQNMDVLSSPDNIKILANVLKTNVAACTSIGSFYLPQLGRIFLDMLGLYKAVSGIVSDTIQKEGLFFFPGAVHRQRVNPVLYHHQVLLQPKHQKFDNYEQ